jgi:hypothetical protein
MVCCINRLGAGDNFVRKRLGRIGQWELLDILRDEPPTASIELIVESDIVKRLGEGRIGHRCREPEEVGIFLASSRKPIAIAIYDGSFEIDPESWAL